MLFYLCCALVVFVWLESAWLGGCAASLCGLFALYDARAWLRARECLLTLDAQGSRIALEQAGQPYFFTKYKVYPTRWFAILKLNDSRKTRTILLTPNRFDSPQRYHDCRFTLRQMEAARVA